MPFTVHPEPNTTILSNEVAEHFAQIVPLRDRVHEGFDLTVVGNNGTISVGTAYINGYEVGDGGDLSENVTLPNGTVGIYVDTNGDVTATTGAPPANSIILWTVEMTGGFETDRTDQRFTEVSFVEQVSADSFEALGADAFFKGFRALLEGTKPHLEWLDNGGGYLWRVISQNGKLQLIRLHEDGSNSFLVLDDLQVGPYKRNITGFVDFTAAEPAGPSIGDRYINTGDGSTSITAQSVLSDDVLEWDGNAWIEDTPATGWILLNETDEELTYYTGAQWRTFGTSSADANELVRRSATGRASFAPATIDGQALVAGSTPWLREEKTADFQASDNVRHYHCNHATPNATVNGRLPDTPYEGMLVIFTTGDNNGGLQILESTVDQSPINVGGVPTDGDGTGGHFIIRRSTITLSYEDGHWMPLGGGGGGGGASLSTIFHHMGA